MTMIKVVPLYHNAEKSCIPSNDNYCFMLGNCWVYAGRLSENNESEAEAKFSGSGAYEDTNFTYSFKIEVGIMYIKEQCE